MSYADDVIEVVCDIATHTIDLSQYEEALHLLQLIPHKLIQSGIKQISIFCSKPYMKAFSHMSFKYFNLYFDIDLNNQNSLQNLNKKYLVLNKQYDLNKE